MNLASYKAGNNIKTFVFVAALTGLLIAIGYLIGGAPAWSSSRRSRSSSTSPSTGSAGRWR